MSNADAAAIAALNQTLRALIGALEEIHADLDKLGSPRKERPVAGKTLNLDDEFTAFAQSRKRVRCLTCKIDPELREWAERKVEEGAPVAAVSAFLLTQGVEGITPSAMSKHFQNHVA